MSLVWKSDFHSICPAMHCIYCSGLWGGLKPIPACIGLTWYTLDRCVTSGSQSNNHVVVLLQQSQRKVMATKPPVSSDLFQKCFSHNLFSVLLCSHYKKKIFVYILLWDEEDFLSYFTEPLFKMNHSGETEDLCAATGVQFCVMASWNKYKTMQYLLHEGCRYWLTLCSWPFMKCFPEGHMNRADKNKT